ncbi:Retrovirus-related Pol polyprotein from transposon 17.6, partial [Mucuna pruriens]
MHLRDEAKIAFIIDSRTFCYKVMRFGLKNAGATYQRLMDKIFKDVMGHDVEAYVDDMYQLKLNSKKCSFGVQARKFLSFMLTKKGIEANPEICQAVINMKSPQNVKEV